MAVQVDEIAFNSSDRPKPYPKLMKNRNTDTIALFYSDSQATTLKKGTNGASTLGQHLTRGDILITAWYDYKDQLVLSNL